MVYVNSYLQFFFFVFWKFELLNLNDGNPDALAGLKVLWAQTEYISNTSAHVRNKKSGQNHCSLMYISGHFYYHYDFFKLGILAPLDCENA